MTRHRIIFVADRVSSADVSNLIAALMTTADQALPEPSPWFVEIRPEVAT